MDTPKIYVVCLSAYNAGILYGCWVEATQDVDAIYEAIQSMLTNSPIINAKEWSIHDFKGFGNIEIDEYDSIEKIADLVHFIDEHRELGRALLEDYSIETASLLLQENYYGAYENKVDFAYCIIEECYKNVIPEHLSYYFDYMAFTRDLFSSDYFSVEADGKTHVFSNY
ncbi:MAG: antirestriction protein ArdA [Legionella sp.]|nr:antirestriction protein ArdA [Legionella sp.]